MQGPFEVFIFVAFLCLSFVLVLLQHGSKDLEYNFLAPIIIVSAGKLLLSFVFFLAQDGSVKDLMESMSVSKPMIMSYSIAALLYCVYDILSFVNLRLFDPGSFIVLLQLRTVTSAVLWEIAFNRKLSWVKRGALLMIASGSMLKASNQQGGRELQPSMLSIILLGAQIVTNSCASVYNEVLIKKEGQLTLNAKNMMQYGWTILWCLFVGIMSPPGPVGFNPFNPAVWAPMADVRMFPSILTLILLGLVTAAFLKIYDSNWRSVACSFQVASTGVASSIIFGYEFGILDGFAVCTTCFGVWLYARTPADAPALHAHVPVPTEADDELEVKPMNVGKEAECDEV